MADLSMQPEITSETDLPEGHKKTVLDLLPVEWDVTSLANILTPEDKKLRRVPINADKVYRLLTVKLYGKGLTLRSEVAGEKIAANTLFRTEANDFVFSKIDARNGAWGFVPSHLAKGLVSGDFPILKLNRAKADKDFVELLLARSAVWEPIRNIAAGTTNRRRIQVPQFLAIKVPVPPLPEQRAIAHVLRTVHKATETTEQVIEASRELKRSLMNHLFTYGPVPVDEAERVPLKETEIGLVPEHWDTVQLGSLSHVQSGGTPSRKQNKFYGGHIQWVKSLDLNEGVVTDTQEKITDEGLRSIRGKVRPAGTVMIAMYGGAGTIGKSGILGVPAATNQAVCCVEPNPNKFLSNFLFHYFIHVRPAWMKHAIGTRKDPNISKGVIQRSHIPLPPLHEQQEISRMLGTVATKIAVEENRKQTFEIFFKTLLHNLMTGKIRVGDLNVSEVENTVR